jgi:hypothetical protein
MRQMDQTYMWYSLYGPIPDYLRWQFRTSKMVLMASYWVEFGNIFNTFIVPQLRVNKTRLLWLD